MSYNSVPAPNSVHKSRGYGDGSGRVADLASTPAHPVDSSPLSQSLPQNSRYDEADSITESQFETAGAGVNRSASQRSVGGGVSRNNTTLSKSGSVKRKTSLRRSGSRRSIHAGGLKPINLDAEGRDIDANNIFYTPIPTQGSPTDVLANRFTAWRKFLKDLIAYFREVQASYETRAKASLKVSNVISNTNAPSYFMTEGGINDANQFLRDFHKHALTEANKARDIENDVINQLGGLRQDLAAKIKEIKSLSGDFKNSVDKEKEVTRKAVAHLESAIDAAEHGVDTSTGKDDPYVIRLAVDRQVEKQIDEENYLHRAYLNLEHSGRELESIVVGEIQKAYNAYASILKREADENYNTVEKLRSGPITMPKDKEWSSFVETDPLFISPDVPLRRVEDIVYSGKDHPTAAEVRAGMLERKSKYLKSYTPGWYVLSPTHLHEFKSADRIYSQPPVMSLFLPNQKLGSHSQDGSSSHKFALKGSQTGRGHTGHNWVFRAETYDTMMAWYDDIRTLTTTTPTERDAFVRKHARSMSASSQNAPSIDSGLDEDEADATPYSATANNLNPEGAQKDTLVRPQPGGRFPSDLQVTSGLREPLSPSSGTSDENDTEVGAAGAVAGAGIAAKDEDDAAANADRVTPARKEPYGGWPEMRHASSVTGGVPGQASTEAKADGGAAADTAATEEYWRARRADAEQAKGTTTETAAADAAGHQQKASVSTAGETATTPTLSVGASTAPSTLSELPATPKDGKNATANDVSRDGESNATPTGRIIPTQRNDTEVSVQDLHVPGGFPAPTPGTSSTAST